MIFHIALGTVNKEYPNLIAREFLITYNALCLDGNMCNFQEQGKKWITHKEMRFSHIKDWSRLLFFVLGLDWEFLKSEIFHKEFLVRAI